MREGEVRVFCASSARLALTAGKNVHGCVQEAALKKHQKARPTMRVLHKYCFLLHCAQPALSSACMPIRPPVCLSCPSVGPAACCRAKTMLWEYVVPVGLLFLLLLLGCRRSAPSVRSSNSQAGQTPPSPPQPVAPENERPSLSLSLSVCLSLSLTLHSPGLPARPPARPWMLQCIFLAAFFAPSVPCRALPASLLFHIYVSN